MSLIWRIELTSFNLSSRLESFQLFKQLQLKLKQFLREFDDEKGFASKITDRYQVSARDLDKKKKIRTYGYSFLTLLNKLPQMTFRSEQKR